MAKRTDLGLWKDRLESEFQAGLTGYSSTDNKKKLEELSVETGLSVKTLKIWICNRRRAGKQLTKTKVYKRKPTAYNLFTEEFMRKNKGKAGSTDLLKESALAWKQVRDSQEGESFKEKAGAFKSPDVKDMHPEEKKVVAQRLLNSLAMTMEKLHECNYSAMVVAVANESGSVHEAGTPQGQAFLHTHNTSYNFSNYVLGKSEDFTVLQPLESLRATVQTILNNKMRQAGLKRRFSYKDLENGRLKVKGLPENLELKTPGSMGRERLQEIVNLRDEIEIEVVRIQEEEPVTECDEVVRIKIEEPPDESDDGWKLQETEQAWYVVYEDDASCS